METGYITIELPAHLIDDFKWFMINRVEQQFSEFYHQTEGRDDKHVDFEYSRFTKTLKINEYEV